MSISAAKKIEFPYLNLVENVPESESKKITNLESLSGQFEKDSIRGFASQPMTLNEKNNNLALQQGRRNAPRFVLKLEIMVSTATESMRTTTENISESGILLSNSLPLYFIGKTVDIVLINKKDNLRKFLIFKGEVVSSGLNMSPRLHLTASALNSQEALSKILEELL